VGIARGESTLLADAQRCAAHDGIKEAAGRRKRKRRPKGPAFA